jgi:cytochrome c553/enamine deaminase RidA (YjgF/YER057c/UK114 family)
MDRRANGFLPLLLGAVLAAPALAELRDPKTIAAAPEPFRYCVVCHGVELMGNREVDAPRLAGLPEWYLAHQMEAFRRGWRGLHGDDVNGMEMRPQATVLSERQMAEVVRWSASMPAGPAPAATVEGDAERGRSLYQPCAVCHGERGEGNEAMQSPPLAGQNDWYLVVQLENFRAGIRGSAEGDTQGALMRASSMTLDDHGAVADVVAYINTLSLSNQGDNDMNKTLSAAALTAGLAAAAISGAAAAEVTRYPIPGSDFPIAQAVEVSAGTNLVFHSGTVPGPANPEAERFSAEFWGDTEAQTMSVFGRLEQSLAAKGLGFGDVVKMQVYLVGVPELDGAMDFQGFMTAYRRYFGTEEQPNLPARSTFQVAGLASPGMLVEIEVVLARP